MKKLCAMLMVLCMMCGVVAVAAEPVRVYETEVFTLSLPEGWNIYSTTDYVAMRASWGFGSSPTQYQATFERENESYGGSLYVYKFPTRDKGIVDRKSDKNMGCFEVLMSYSGMAKYESKMNPQRVRYATDSRTFVVAEIKGEDGFLASYYNQSAGLGYLLYLHGDLFKKIPFDSAQAEVYVEECLLSLSEPGISTTIDPNAVRYVVITNSSANVRSGPGGDYAKVTTARQGDTFPLIGEEGSWYIIDVNGQTGYVTKSLSAIQ